MSSQPQAPGATAPASLVSLDAMLSLQEVDPPLERDRRARRHGASMLDALARLQQALLGDEVPIEALHRLAGLAQAVPLAADPALRGLMAEISLRAQVELARHDSSAASHLPVR